MSRRLLLALGLIATATLVRLLPHPPNFAPLGAMGLFGAFYFRRSLGLLVPFVALFLSDLVLNNMIYSQYYPEFTFVTSVWMYVALAGVMLTGLLVFRRSFGAVQVVSASVGASVVFFLISNFSTFWDTNLYPKTWAGLMACYTAGLPFFTNTLISDLMYSAVLFGAYSFITRRFPAIYGTSRA